MPSMSAIPMSARRPGLRLRPALLAMANWLRASAERRRQRRALLDLSDALLEDIGVSRAEALAEASKPCWRRR
jgi:uncharacterized protein YjiS (DUF1127 family)